MKTEELRKKLSRLQSRVYNLQNDIQQFIAELDREQNNKNHADKNEN